MEEKRGFFHPRFGIYAGLLTVFLVAIGLITGLSIYVPQEHLFLYSGISFAAVLLLGLYLLVCFLVKTIILVKNEKYEYGGLFNALWKHKRFRRLVSTFFGSLVSLVFGVVYLVLSYLERSLFYALLSEFYLLILAARTYLSHAGLNGKDERKPFLWASIMTLFLSVAMFGIVSYHIWLGQGFHAKSFILMIANAVYAFWKLVMAIISYFSARGDENAYLLFSYSLIGMASALFTMYALQVSMLYTFGEGTQGNFFFIYGGFLFAGLLLLIGLLGLIRAIKAIRK